MKSYSQYGEDIEIFKALGDTSPPGLVWDFGAWQPEIFSNSRMLIEAGWDAVLVEPSPGPLRDLVKFYGNAEAVTIIGAAVACNHDLLKLQVTDDAVTSSDAGVRNVWAEQGGYFGWLTVGTVTPEQIAIQFGGADVILIDTEGSSVDIAKRCWELGYGPKVMCVEFDDRLHELQMAAGAAGYMTWAVTTANAILVRR